jgi:hypothetical protein
MTVEWPDWRDETCFILGGGPSLKGFDVERLRGRRVIAPNESGLTLAPWADILFWGDIRWVNWNLERVHLHTGAWRYTTTPHRQTDIPRAQLVRWQPRVPGTDRWAGLSSDPEVIAGFDGGGKCINIAYHTGAARVVLLGFDMRDMADWRDGYFHSAHKEPPPACQRANQLIPVHEALAASVPDLPRPFDVLNATPGSALTCWPMVDLEIVLGT